MRHPVNDLKRRFYRAIFFAPRKNYEILESFIFIVLSLLLFATTKYYVVYGK